MKTLLSILIAQFIIMAPSVCPARADERAWRLGDAIVATVEETADDLIAFRRDLHRHPEVAGQEKRTARKIAERMRALGLDVRTGVGGHGVVAVLKGGKPGPVVAYRADMDALAFHAPDPVAEIASETPGVRHVCGHDVHVTIAVGIAEALASVRSELPGTVKFVFQPAEENAEGAAAVIADGALENPEPEAIWALHCAPVEVGQFVSCSGRMLGGVDLVRLSVHGDKSDLDRTPEAIANECINAMGELMESGPGGFIELGLISSGTNEETGAHEAVGIVRASDDERHAKARKGIKEVVALASEGGADLALEITPHAIPPVENDPELVKRTNVVLRGELDADAVIVQNEPTPSFSEDFSHFQRQIPGALYFIGVANAAEGIIGMPHHPMFQVDERAIPLGVRVMSRVLVDYVLESGE